VGDVPVVIGGGFIVDFRDPDNIALELTAPRG
jgi:hypothetical protein